MSLSHDSLVGDILEIPTAIFVFFLMNKYKIIPGLNISLNSGRSVPPIYLNPLAFSFSWYALNLRIAFRCLLLGYISASKIAHLYLATLSHFIFFNAFYECFNCILCYIFAASITFMLRYIPHIFQYRKCTWMEHIMLAHCI